MFNCLDQEDNETDDEHDGEELVERKRKASADESNAEDVTESKLRKCEQDMANSVTHRKEYMRFTRWVNSDKRFPAKLQAALATQDP